MKILLAKGQKFPYVLEADGYRHRYICSCGELDGLMKYHKTKNKLQLYKCRTCQNERRMRYYYSTGREKIREANRRYYNKKHGRTN